MGKSICLTIGGYECHRSGELCVAKTYARICNKLVRKFESGNAMRRYNAIRLHYTVTDRI